MSLHFDDPLVLLLLLLVPFAFRAMRQDRGAAIRFSSLSLVRALPPSRSVKARQLLLVARALALTLFIVALARPQSGRKLTEISSEGVDIMLVMDTSKSMEAMDFALEGQRASRLEVVKKVVQDFIKKQAGNRLGLVVFGTEAFTQSPLTLDYGVMMAFIERLETGMAGDATAIGSAISVATNRIKEIPAKSKVIVLLTDGASNAGPVGPIEAAKAAATFGVKIYTVGIGSEGMAPMPRQTLLGTFLEPVKVEYDDATLKEIAELTGGSYWKATDTDTLKQIYATIDQLEKTEKKVKEHMEYNELFAPVLLAGLALLLLEIVLANTRLRKLP